jgi:transposase InsO family protein
MKRGRPRHYTRRGLGLVRCQPRPWRPTTTQPGEGAESISDLEWREFTTVVPGTRLVGEMTYLPAWQGFAYLATVIDCCTKECLGYAIADHTRAELAMTRYAWPLATTASHWELSSIPIAAPNTSARSSPRQPPTLYPAVG